MTRPGRNRKERGATAVLVAIFLLAVGAFLALVLNIAHALDNHAQMLAAADSAALAGAGYLDGTAAGLAAAHVKGQEFAQAHKIDRDGITIDENTANTSTGDVVHGCWDDKTSVANKGTAFTPYPDAVKCPTARDVNAVLVRNGQDGSGSHNARMQTYFGYFVNKSDVAVHGEGVAVGGGPCDSCAIPVTFAACQILDAANNLNCTQILRFSDANVDQIGLTSLSSTDPASTSNVIDAACPAGKAPACVCPGGAPPPCCRDVSDLSGDINVANGNNLNCNMADAFAQYVGQKISVPILDFPCDTSSSPPNVQFNQPHAIVGFATMTLEAVCGDNAKKGSSKCSYANAADTDPATGLPYECPGGGRAVIIKLDCSETANKRSGCKPFGTLSPPRLVR